MKTYDSDDDETEKTDGFFDPFWMLFADEEDVSDESGARRKRRTRKKAGRRSREKSYDDYEGSGVFDYFMSEAGNDSLLGRSEDREPPQQNKRFQGRQKKQHYWRRNQPKLERQRRLSFGRRSNSKRNLTNSSNNSVDSGNNRGDRRDLPDRSAETGTRTDDGNSNEFSGDFFPDNAFPSFMEAIASRWDPWGEQESSSDSSVQSYADDESSHADDSMASRSKGSRSRGTTRQQEVQQVLIQFNPAASASAASAATATPSQRSDSENVEQRATPGTNMTRLSPRDLVDDNLLLQSETGPARAFGNDESTLSSYEKMERIDIFGPQIEFDIHDGKRSSNKCLDLNRRMRRSRLFNRSKSSGGLNDESYSATVFPKLRMVADEKDSGAKTSAVVATSKNFKGNVPAHLQLAPEAFSATKGPQSLYEYEYDGGEHIDVAYNHFGPNPLSLIVIRHHMTPPRLRDLGAIVQVEASTISMTDCSMRSGEWLGKDTPPLPITPGVDLVGKVFRIDQEMAGTLDLSAGDRVISLTRCGGNSRFLSIDPWQLVKISEEVDPAEAACLAETYLSAFQVLHFGQSAGLRYKSNALRGKTILLMGTVATTLGHAIVEVASVAGVSKIIATSAPKHFPHLRSLGIIPVSQDPALWYDQLNGCCDLVIASNTNEEVVAEHFRVLNDRGHLIVIGQRLGSGMPIGEWESESNTKKLICKRQRTKASMIDRTHEYNPFRQWEQDLEKSKRDLSHLVKLLEKGDIKPNVLDRIPLNKVAKAQDMVESQRHPGGFLVCEPWLRNKKRAVRL